VDDVPFDEADARPAAYIADDGTRMIEVAPHQYVNRCAFNRRQHVWKLHGKDSVCTGSGRVAADVRKLT
jgi:hypothetical protein